MEKLKIFISLYSFGGKKIKVIFNLKIVSVFILLKLKINFAKDLFIIKRITRAKNLAILISIFL